MKLDELPAHVRAAIDRGRVRPAAPTPTPAAPTKKRRGTMNKTEARYAVELELGRQNGVLLWWAFEPITLRLATGARFTPDFAVLTSAGALECHETKGGFIREAAMVRLKVAASLYPFRFVLVQFTKGTKTERTIAP